MYDLKQNYNGEGMKKKKHEKNPRAIPEKKTKKKSKNKTNSAENTQGHRGKWPRKLTVLGDFPLRTHKEQEYCVVLAGLCLHRVVDV